MARTKRKAAFKPGYMADRNLRDASIEQIELILKDKHAERQRPLSAEAIRRVAERYHQCLHPSH